MPFMTLWLMALSQKTFYNLQTPIFHVRELVKNVFLACGYRNKANIDRTE